MNKFCSSIVRSLRPRCSTRQLHRLFSSGAFKSNLLSGKIDDPGRFPFVDLDPKARGSVTTKNELENIAIHDTEGMLERPTQPTVSPNGEIPWFPTKEEDLDLIGQTLLVITDGLNLDHPYFTDQEYRNRRNNLCKISSGYKMRDPIPVVEYSAEEHKLWGNIYQMMRPLHKELACQGFNYGVQQLENLGIFSPEFIPQQEALNSFFRKTSNWRIKPVNGILSQREFLNCLAFRTFCSSMYIRHPLVPEYTPEPDILHEYLGHIPNFIDPRICEISQRLGELSLGASDEQIAEIGSIYFFTVEFGLCKEDGQTRIYGAGPAGSVAEFKNIKAILQNPQNRLKRLDITQNDFPTELIIQDVQPVFYVAESFEDYLRQLEIYASNFKKPFNLRYVESTNSYEIDNSVSTQKHTPHV